MKARKITFALSCLLSVHILALYGKLEGSGVVAIYCALAALFNIANSVEHITGGKNGNDK